MIQQIQGDEEVVGELSLEQAIGQKLLVSFQGHTLPVSFEELLRRRHIAGVTLFRAFNVQNPAQVRELSAALQRAAAASGQPPLLIAADQEGGTLLALAGSTPFPGNMALGATHSPELARRAGRAIGLELAAMGINVNYAPVCDVNVNPRNPVIGPRSFGEDPAEVARMAAAMTEGLQEAGVAATAKHFPGHGDTSTDSHHGTPVLPFDEERLRRVELPPFVEAIQAGAKLVMSAHIALPGLTNGVAIPATLSRPIITGLLRNTLGFEGVIVSDALDMGAVRQGREWASTAVEAVAAGIDLLLLMDSGRTYESVYEALLRAARRGALSPQEIAASARRVLELKRWVSKQHQPGLEVVQCAEHRALAYEIAARSVTLVRDQTGSLPIRLSPEERILVIVPRPADLTPADTSSYDTPRLAEALQKYHPQVDEVVVPLDVAAADAAALRERAKGYALTIVGTINASDHPAQASLVNALLESGTRVIAVALRLPYDIASYPIVPTYVCTYSLHMTPMEALADALWGSIPFQGQLPVMVAGF
ncbi:MAG TPA: glycoside hydrolase family 3 protein [Chloroflexia bacterium]|nr:glycoside hydrolase family 3 protein [Chloroflexia bacterium]